MTWLYAAHKPNKNTLCESHKKNVIKSITYENSLKNKFLNSLKIALKT